MIQLTQYKEYRKYLAEKLRQSSVAISDQWLQKLEDVVNEDTRDVFPTEQYLDHIPLMIEEIANVLERAEDELALANSLIDRKAMELGALRHQQKATVNQLLREYDILSKILEDFVTEQTSAAPLQVSHTDGIRIMASMARIVRSILQATVDSFVEKYVGTIHEQTEKILSFNKFVSHELKTPLQAAALNLELILDSRDQTADDIQDLIRIQTSVQQASLLLKNIENLTENSDGATSDNPVQQEIELSAIARDIETQLQETLKQRGVELIIDDELGCVTLEIAKLRMVFTNILTNAIKYSDPAKSKRTVAIRKGRSDDPNLATVIIEDNGLGIDEDMQADVFKLRVRAHENQDEMNDVTGYGLGLYLVSEAMRDLGGTIELESTVGLGSTITLVFPQIQSL